MLSFELNNLKNEKISYDRVVGYSLSRDIDAPCDGLRLSLYSTKPLDEIYSIKAYDGDKIIFNGYVDTQREQFDKNGFSTFVYARSSACVLIDNEAMPATYKKPSAKTLFMIYAQELGFTYELPDINCFSDYMVGKGVSCYDALNNLVCGTTGKNIMVGADNALRLSKENQLAIIDKGDVISEKRCINRGSPISCIDYKIEGDRGYSHHRLSRFFQSQKIMRRRKMNISSLPLWQRETALKNKIQSAALKYNTIEIELYGCAFLPLYAGVCYESSFFGDVRDYSILSCNIICDSKGERTKVKLCKNFDLKEISYVAE